MKVTLEQLIQSQPALNELAGAKGLPLKTSYWTGKLLRKNTVEIQHYDKARMETLESFGATPNRAAGVFEFPSPAAKADFITQHAELLATEIELPGDGFKLDQLGEATISAASMMQLDWLITE